MGALVDGPELADFGSHCFLAGARSDQTASSLRTGDQSALTIPPVPRRLLCRAGRPGVSSACRIRPWLSLGFPRVPFLFLRGVYWGLEWNAGRRSAAFMQVRDLRHWSG